MCFCSGARERVNGVKESPLVLGTDTELPPSWAMLTTKQQHVPISYASPADQKVAVNTGIPLI